MERTGEDNPTNDQATIVPKEAKSEVVMDVSHFVFHRDLRTKANGSRDFGDSDNCQINVECKEGDNWKDQKNSVVRILLKVDKFYGWCSGSIMNNTAQDCTPYILTADHCREGDGGIKSDSLDYTEWEFYFKYQSARCRNPNDEGDVDKVKLTGCRYLASSENGGEGDSDFLLVKLKDQIPEFYSPRYAGWDARGNAPNSGVMIHHPKGDIKKISTYAVTAESSEWKSSVKGTHWKIYWSKTSNGFGVSEGGRSGPLMLPLAFAVPTLVTILGGRNRHNIQR